MLYNEYRPDDFLKVIGQEKVMDSLKFQSLNKNFVHSYLFCGHHGTGKTTVGRILARAANCLHPTEGGPCNECENCIEKHPLDIIEIDGASNNGVEHIKELIGNTKYKPIKLPMKIYIIDEVHMLSIAAFNALLKTLEEPPQHCMFILCTTELHKIPLTIVSRCECYTFEAIKEVDIKKQLVYILSNKGLDYEDQALSLIAKNANGALRDAISILDQMILCSDGKIFTETVRMRLALINEKIPVDIIYDILCHKTKDVLRTLEQVNNEGKSLVYLIEQILEELGNLIILKSSFNEDCGDRKLLLTKSNLEELFFLVDQFTNLREKIRSEINPMMSFYLLLLKVSNQDVLQEDTSYLRAEMAKLRERVHILEQVKLSGQSKEIIMEKNAVVNSHAYAESTANLLGEEGGSEKTNNEPEETQPEENEVDQVEVEDQADTEESPFGDLFDFM